MGAGQVCDTSSGRSRAARISGFLLGGLLLLALSMTAHAEEDQLSEIVEECTAPCAEFEISTELQGDRVFWANPPALESYVLQPTITADLVVAPTDYLRLATSIITEPVVDPAPGADAVFAGIGTYVAELYTMVETGPATTRLGKFDTIFSLFSEVAPGINADDLASDLDADERVGGEVVLGFEGLGLNHALAATLFSTDRTVLSESLFTNRGRTSLAEGGAGNTNGLSSFSITLDGCEGSEPADCYWDGEFGYRLGFRYQRAGRPTEEDIEDGVKTGDETAYLAAATRSFEVDDMTLRLLGEVAFLRHFDGGEDDALTVTGSAALEADTLTYIASYTQQMNIVADGADTSEHLADFEVLYSPDGDKPLAETSWQLGAAYTFAVNEEHEKAHMFSVRAVFNFSGEVEFGR